MSILVAGLAGAGWLVGGTDLLLVVVLTTVVAGITVLGYMAAQSERHLRSELNREVGRMSASNEATTRTLDKLRRSVAEQVARTQQPGEHAEALLRGLKASLRRHELEHERRMKAHVSDVEQAIKQANAEIRERLTKAERKQARQFKHAPAEIDALLQVHRRLALNDPLPLMGGFALSPRGMLQAIELAGQPSVSLVVECGSGTSTVYLARSLELAGGERRLIALEHLPEFVEYGQHALKQHRLDHLAEVRYAPLEPVDIQDASYMWYTTASIADVYDIDMLLVDGPPGNTGSLARYPAYPLLRDRLSASAVILVDDLYRSDERTMVDLWLQLGGITESRSHTYDQAILRVG